MTSCSGLPICLSGIQIFPHHVQRPKAQHMGSRMRVKAVPPVDAPARSVDGEGASSDCENGGSMAVPMTVPASDILRENSTAESSSSEPCSNRPNLPRLALARQMADLDYRREAVRRRSIHVSASLVDYRLSSRQSAMRSMLLEHQAKLEEQSSCTEKSVCAKAA